MSFQNDNNTPLYYNQGLVILDTTPSDSNTTGSLVIHGGLGIQGSMIGTHAELQNAIVTNATFTNAHITGNATLGNLRIMQDLYVEGTTYSVNVTSMNMVDANLTTGTLNRFCLTTKSFPPFWSQA